MSRIEAYFDTSVFQPRIETTVLDGLWNDDGEGWLICGDFWGIQKFIFEGLSSKNAAKVLRAKSAFVELFTEYIARYICHTVGIGEEHIISQNAGKFEILSPKKADIGKIQEALDRYFMEKFYGMSGMSLCMVETSSRAFGSEEAYRALRDEVSEAVEVSKFVKFSLPKRDPLMEEYDTDIDNQSLCRVCNIRKIVYTNDESCDVCHGFTMLGKLLAIDSLQEVVSEKEVGIERSYFDGFTASLALDERIKSYIQYEYDESANQRIPVSFETLAKASCGGDKKQGVKTLAVLKADADHMGRFIRESNVTAGFENFDGFSKGMDAFFSLHIAARMREKYPNTYTVFGGGDDLFIVGAWDEVLALAREVHESFGTYVKGELSLSMGIALAKPSTPISYLAEHTEHLLEDAKGIDEQKDALSMFGETVKWKDYIACYELLLPALESQHQVTELKTAWLYRVLELADMGKRVKYDGSITDTIWRSKLNYTIRRNVERTTDGFISALNTAIERYPKETKLVLTEFIYKRRKM